MLPPTEFSPLGVLNDVYGSGIPVVLSPPIKTDAEKEEDEDDDLGLSPSEQHAGGKESARQALITPPTAAAVGRGLRERMSGLEEAGVKKS